MEHACGWHLATALLLVLCLSNPLQVLALTAVFVITPLCFLVASGRVVIALNDLEKPARLRPVTMFGLLQSLVYARGNNSTVTPHGFVAWHNQDNGDRQFASCDALPASFSSAPPKPLPAPYIVPTVAPPAAPIAYTPAPSRAAWSPAAASQGPTVLCHVPQLRRSRPLPRPPIKANARDIRAASVARLSAAHKERIGRLNTAGPQFHPALGSLPTALPHQYRPPSSQYSYPYTDPSPSPFTPDYGSSQGSSRSSLEAPPATPITQRRFNSDSRGYLQRSPSSASGLSNNFTAAGEPPCREQVSSSLFTYPYSRQALSTRAFSPPLVWNDRPNPLYVERDHQVPLICPKPVRPTVLNLGALDAWVSKYDQAPSPSPRPAPGSIMTEEDQAVYKALIPKYGQRCASLSLVGWLNTASGGNQNKSVIPPHMSFAQFLDNGGLRTDLIKPSALYSATSTTSAEEPRYRRMCNVAPRSATLSTPKKESADTAPEYLHVTPNTFRRRPWPMFGPETSVVQRVSTIPRSNTDWVDMELSQPLIPSGVRRLVYTIEYDHVDRLKWVKGPEEAWELPDTVEEVVIHVVNKFFVQYAPSQLFRVTWDSIDRERVLGVEDSRTYSQGGIRSIVNWTELADRLAPQPGTPTAVDELVHSLVGLATPKRKITLVGVDDWNPLWLNTTTDTGMFVDRFLDIASSLLKPNQAHLLDCFEFPSEDSYMRQVGRAGFKAETEHGML